MQRLPSQLCGKSQAHSTHPAHSPASGAARLYLLSTIPYSYATPLAGQPQQNHNCSLLWLNKDHTAQKMLYALTKTSLKYASFAAQRSCSRPLILRAKEGTSRVDNLPFSHPSAPLTYKHALGKLPQLHLLPFERQKKWYSCACSYSYANKKRPAGCSASLKSTSVFFDKNAA